MLRAWEQDGLWKNVVLDETVPPHDEKTAAMPEALPSGVRAALAARGVERLYAHQAEAFERAHRGEHVVIATPTASGKSLCYNLPVLTRLSEDPAARALYLFPTKALSRDQEEAFRGFAREAGVSQGAITYDGDTPGDARRAARDRAGVLLTNPDMLHAGILPHHASWARLFSNLRFIVVDELHTYRGVFGSHLANVMRRLRRVARFHGSDPVFIFASATIGNPKEHAERIVGDEVSLISESGAPTGPRRVLVYNPPVVNAELGIRASYLKTAVRLTCDLVAAKVPTLVFGQSRNGVEVMLKYLRDRLPRYDVDPQSIHAYRGGYLPDTRRRIEAGLRGGDVRCVVATSALELGIDIGSLDAVVCAGYPGTIAGTWQRFGRAGRRRDPALSLLVTSSAPLDQYVAGDPRHLIGAPVEQARIDPDNVEILLQHLKCAAFELPFVEGDSFGDLPIESLDEALGFLASHEVLHPSPGPNGGMVYHWATDSYPANNVSLRSASWDNFVIIDLDRDRTIAEMDWHSTHTMLHVQAIYQHEGLQYQVERLDFENHKAFVRKVAPDYYTTAMTHTKVTVIEQDDAAAMQFGQPAEFGARGSRSTDPGVVLSAAIGEVNVVERVVGFKKIKFHSHENVGYGEVHLPEMEKHTTSFWLTFPESFVQSRPEPRPTVIDALRGLSKAMHLVAAVGLMIDPRDLGRTLGDRDDPDAPPGKGHGPGFDPTIFLYDQVAGGIGLAPRLFDERDALLRRTRSLVDGCACDFGCPTCIGPAAGTPMGPPAIAVEPVAIDRRALVLTLLDAIGLGAIH